MQIERADNFMRGLGLEVYRVGGSVRDEVLGRRPKDADYMIRGVELDVLFDVLEGQGRAYQVSPLKLRDGRVAGARVSRKGLGLVEIVLPRKEVSTGPGHRDFEIVLDPHLELIEDARRRDFTFNALYKVISHPDGLRTTMALPDGREVLDVIDPLGGIDDLLHRTIRVTHYESFRDDPLRTLRALRFVSTLGYDLSPSTYADMEEHAQHVTGLTQQARVVEKFDGTKLHYPAATSGTVLDELSKLLMGANPGKALRLARDTGVLAVAFPELEAMLGFKQDSRYHDLTTDEHVFCALDTAAKVDAPLRVRMALLFHDAGKPESGWRGDDGRLHYYSRLTEDGLKTDDHETVGVRLWLTAAKRLNAPRDLRDDVAHLIRHHMVTVEGKLKASKVRRMRVEHGDEMLRDLLMHRACDVSGKGKPNMKHIERLGAMEAIRAKAEADKVPATVRDLAVGGKDAAELGLRGPEIGAALRRVLLEVASEPNATHLTREWQMRELSRRG